MLNSLIALFPDHEIFMNFPLRNMNEKTALLPITQTIELDVAIPKLGIGFEYQGVQHYQDNILFGDAAVWRKVGRFKVVLMCREMITKRSFVKRMEFT